MSEEEKAGCPNCGGTKMRELTTITAGTKYFCVACNTEIDRATALTIARQRS